MHPARLALVSFLALVATACGAASEPPTTTRGPEPPSAETQAPTTASATAPAEQESQTPSCFHLPGSEFESVEEHEIGLLADGTVATGRWSLHFTQARVEWQYSDVLELLEYQCEQGSIETSDESAPGPAGMLTVVDEQLEVEWDGVAYQAVIRGDTSAYQLPDPAEVVPGAAEDALLFGMEVVETLLAGDVQGWRSLVADQPRELLTGGIIDAAKLDRLAAISPFPEGRDLSSYDLDDYLWRYEPRIHTFAETVEMFDGLDIEAVLLEAGWQRPESAFFFRGDWPRGDAPGFNDIWMLLFVAGYDGEHWEIATVLTED